MASDVSRFLAPTCRQNIVADSNADIVQPTLQNFPIQDIVKLSHISLCFTVHLQASRRGRRIHRGHVQIFAQLKVTGVSCSLQSPQTAPLRSVSNNMVHDLAQDLAIFPANFTIDGHRSSVVKMRWSMPASSLVCLA